MKFQNELHDIAAATERELHLLLPDAAGDRLRAAMRYAVIGKGKRLRPFYVVASCELFGISRAQAMRVAAALECVHCYSLAHDDLPAMDDDDLRRGQPSLHKKFDEATAILAGDGLLTFAFQILGEDPTHNDAKVRADLVVALARAAGEAGMVGGQMRDIEAETTEFESLEEISGMQLMKTGALFGFACISGAIMASADQAPLKTYAEKIGLAFQIADDLLDLRSDAKSLGKATQKDNKQGKATFVDFLGEHAAEARAYQLVDEAVEAVAVYGDKAVRFVDAARFVVERKK